MIHYDLICEQGHEFDGWFASSDSFQDQLSAAQVACPHCASVQIEKMLMAPRIATSRQKQDRKQKVQNRVDKQMAEAMGKLRTWRKQLIENADYVGDRFPEEARDIHYGEKKDRHIYGETSLKEARDLIDEGIEIAPLPEFPEDKN